MKYIVPSSKIVFTDFMILLVSLLTGLNSVMSFSEDNRLPPVNLPVTSGSKEVGCTAANPAFITIRSGEKGNTYFYNQKEVTLCRLMELIQKATVATVILRGDRKASFEWQEFCQLTSQLMKAGVKEISYATTISGGTRP